MSGLTRYVHDDSGPARADALTATATATALPYPDGWFCLAFSDELPPGGVLTRTLMGEEVVLYRTRGGVLRAVRPYCPHLGAHLGAGGAVEGENIVCPFHRFAFDTSGTCVATGYGLQPPKAALTRYDVCEVNSSVYVWRHALGEPPTWEVPALHGPRPSVFRHTTVDLAGHPQMIVENAFDFGHLTQLHGLSGLTIDADPVIGEPTCTIPVTAGGRALVPSASYELTVVGLSTLAAVARLGPLGDMYVLLHATPTAPGRLHLRLGATVALEKVPFVPDVLGRLTTDPLSQLFSRLAHHITLRDAAPDFPVWNHQIYVEHPKLAPGDGPVGRYRRWARQFYSAPAGGDVPVAPPRT